MYRTLLCSIVLSIVAGRAVAAPKADVDSADDVAAYALGCYAELGFKADDLPAKLDCKAGTLLPTVLTDPPGPTPAQGATKTFTAEAGTPAGADVVKDFPKHCDYPAWLNDKCYGQSYVQKIPVTGHAEIAAAMLCRHKKVWTNDKDEFDDVAIIMQNVKTGKTCWFNNDVAADATALTPPHVKPTTGWGSPKYVASYHCNGCHDSGPWQTSPWIFKVGVVPKDRKIPYINVGKVFDGSGNTNWSVARPIAIGAKGMQPSKGNQLCTSCHPISATLYKGKPNAFRDHGDGPNRGTSARWIDWTTGMGFPASTSEHGQRWIRSGWMPSSTYPPNHKFKDDDAKKADFIKAYADHLKALKKCAEAAAVPPGANPPAPVGLPNGCEVPPYKPVAALGGPTRATAVAHAGIQTLQKDATLAADWVYGTIDASIGDNVTFEWDAEGVTSCEIETTIPDALTSANGVRTADNWQTTSGTVSLGSLFAPGEYAIDISCDGRIPTSGEYGDSPVVAARVVVRIPCVSDAACADDDPSTCDSCGTDPDSPTGAFVCLHDGDFCDDGDQCTDDTCDPTITGFVCGHTVDDGGPCDDGHPCTVGDVCDNGDCVSGSPADCDDGNPCTDDACASVGGSFVCTNDPNTGSCDDDNRCTVDDECRDGTCAGDPDLQTCHFQCYELRPVRGSQHVVDLQDQFGTFTGLLVQRAQELCTPAEKNDEDPTAPSEPDHLMAYRIRRSGFVPRTDQRVVDQFGELRLDITKPDQLMLPTHASFGGPPPAVIDPQVDHFTCYKVRKTSGTPSFAPQVVTVDDELRTTTLTLRKPLRLCVPTNKNGEEPGASTHEPHLLCYRASHVPFGTANPSVSNQFEDDTREFLRQMELCVPALLNPACAEAGTCSSHGTDSDGRDPTTKGCLTYWNDNTCMNGVVNWVWDTCTGNVLDERYTTAGNKKNCATPAHLPRDCATWLKWQGIHCPEGHAVCGTGPLLCPNGGPLVQAGFCYCDLV